MRLADRADAPVMALSGGMAQRLMVARAIMHRPQILFLDEPTAGLDPQSRIALWEIVEELHAEGETILLTTHYMEEADQLCDRVAIMDHGQILALDTPGAAQAVDRRRHDRQGHRRPADAERLGRHLVDAVDGATDYKLVDGVCCCRPAVRAAAPHRQRRRGHRRRRDRPLRQRPVARDRLHQPDREGPARMTTVTATARHPERRARGLVQLRPARVAYRRAFVALLQRDMHVLLKNWPLFMIRAVMQPLLLMFVFTYVFPKIGQGVGGGGGGEAAFTSTLVAGVVGLAIVFQGSSRSPSRWSRSSATRRRSRTGSWRRCRRRPSASRRS